MTMHVLRVVVVSEEEARIEARWPEGWTVFCRFTGPGAEARARESMESLEAEPE